MTKTELLELLANREEVLLDNNDVSPAGLIYKLVVSQDIEYSEAMFNLLYDTAWNLVNELSDSKVQELTSDFD